jgi:hypothetical protein
MERKNILRLIVVFFFFFLPGLLMIGSHLEGDGDETVNSSASAAAIADRDSST